VEIGGGHGHHPHGYNNDPVLMQRIAALETRGDEAHQMLQRVTEVAKAEQQRNAIKHEPIP
jgi:hypothetical protein